MELQLPPNAMGPEVSSPAVITEVNLNVDAEPGRC